ncbi:hypothetical protein B4110_1449 [Parageobacillus toebii]|uniref:Uncharacterized protein n=1 Tax=Parageobacillus toebii TaxID=153151 RepID=A0A150MAP0_9BACL|nr:hypothetical protein B4110_1449 [Parageobacillus toebii]
MLDREKILLLPMLVHFLFQMVLLNVNVDKLDKIKGNPI